MTILKIELLIHKNSCFVIRHSKRLNFATFRVFYCVKVLTITCLVSSGIDDKKSIPDVSLQYIFRCFRPIKTFSLAVAAQIIRQRLTV